METLKILVMNWRDITHPSAGGAEVHVHEMAKRWVKDGHEVTLLCGGYEGCKENEEIDGIEVLRRGRPYTVYLHAMKEYLWKLRKTKFDVVIDDINGVPFFTPMYVKKPKVAIMHHLVKDIFFKEIPWHKALIGYTAEKIIPLMYRETPFIATSESTKEDLANFGVPRENIRVVYYGVDEDFLTNRGCEKTKFPSVLYLNRIKRYKNVDHLIRAFKIVKGGIPNAKLLVVGCRGGEYEEELRCLVNALNLQGDVEFCPFVGDVQKKMFLEQAWVHVLPSEREGFGISVIEAAACGTPTVAYNVPGLRCSVKNGETGLLVPYCDIRALAKAIATILSSEEVRGMLSESALKWSMNFSWGRTAEETLNVIREMVK